MTIHTKPMADSEGTFDRWKPTKAENPAFKCRKCGSDDIWYRTWDSDDGGFEDVQYHCRGCGRRWWFEGADA